MSNIADLLTGSPRTPELEAGDSEDFTEEEAELAHLTNSVEHLIQILPPLLVCPQCEGRRTVTAHKLRRKIPHLYTCMDVECNECLIDSQLVFQVDWL